MAKHCQSKKIVDCGKAKCITYE